MLPRRQTLCAAAAGAAIFARIPDVLAATYDLIIKGGRVIDPGAGINAIRDVAIADGRIAAVGADLAADSAAEMIDARGKLVIPGMVDIHTHAGRAKELPAFCLADGVTSFVDAGSAGADRLAGVDEGAKAAPTRRPVFVHIPTTAGPPGGR